jgi:hypothetical protein
MRHALLLLAIVGATALSGGVSTASAQQACYHCQSSSGGTLCNPISPSGGYRTCSAVQGQDNCKISGDTCMTEWFSLNVAPDGAVLAAVQDGADPSAEVRACNGFIVRRATVVASAPRSSGDERQLVI